MRFALKASFAAVILITSSSVTAQTLSLTNFQISAEQQVNRMQWRVSYRADLTNSGSALSSAKAIVTSQIPNVVVVQGQDSLTFPAVPGGGTVTSTNTFTILVDRTVPLDLTQLQWNYQSVLSPVSKPGSDQLVSLGSTVTLDGTGSTNPSGTGTLTYSWAFSTRPTGSSASLINPTNAVSTFTPDLAGTYQITLTVNNGVASNSATVKVSVDTIPVANAGANQAVNVGSLVQLSGAGSSDADNDVLTYSWTLTTRPAGSATQLSSSTSVTPTLIPDLAGVYIVQLIVNDSKFNSPPSTVTLTASAITGTLSIYGVSVGQNLQALISVLLSMPAPAGGLPLTLTSGDKTKLTVSGRPVDSGSESVVMTIPEGSNIISGVLQGLANSGTVSLSASAPGYATNSAAITLTPSGFVLSGPGGLGASFTSSVGQKSGLTVNSARLDAAMNFVETQKLRAGFSTNVSLSADNSSIGTLSTSTLSFSGGSDTATAQFTAVASGTTNVSIGVPAAFSLPNQYQSVTAVVTAASLSLAQNSMTLGQNLQTDGQVLLNGVAPSGGLNVTISSNDPTKLLLSTTASGAGSPSITMNIPAGFAASQSYYLQALGNTGTVTYLATAPGFGNATGTVTLGPSGVVIAGPSGIGATSFSTTTGGANVTISVYPALLDSTLAFSDVQPLRGGYSVSVPVTSSSTTVGSITTSPVTINGGTSVATTQFQPLGSGISNISVGTPAGFNTPTQYTTVMGMVIVPGLALTDDVTIGQNLQTQGSVVLGKQAPAGGLPVTLTVADSSQLLLSATPTDLGSASITITIPAGSSNATYYLQAIGNSGLQSYSASANGYTGRTASAIQLAPSGVVITGPVGFGLPFFIASLSSGLTSALTVYTAQLDPASNTYVTTQPLRGGFQVSASLTNSNTTVGSISPTSVTIGSGADHAGVTFKPLALGNTTISLVKPSGFGLSADVNSLAGTVAQ